MTKTNSFFSKKRSQTIIMHVYHQAFDVLKQGWPDFFSHGPFSITFNVLGAASSFEGVEVAKFLKISLQICENPKRFQKCSSKMSFFGLKSQNFLQK
jgi:hypothetical protein